MVKHCLHVAMIVAEVEKLHGSLCFDIDRFIVEFLQILLNVAEVYL